MGMCVCMCVYTCVHVCARAGTGGWSTATLSSLAQLYFQCDLLYFPFSFGPGSVPTFPPSIRRFDQLLTPATLTCWCSPGPRPSSEAPSSQLNKTPPYRVERKKKVHFISRANAKPGAWVEVGGDQRNKMANQLLQEGEGKALANLS